MDEHLRLRITEEFARRRLRLTHQRQIILDVALGTHEHYAADDVLIAAQKRDSSVSRATVYRTLSLLVEIGLLKRLDMGRRDLALYDPNYTESPHHNHLICSDCQKIVEFCDAQLEAREEELIKKLGFSARSKHLRVEASCDKLHREGSCANVKPTPATAKTKPTFPG